MRLTITIDTDNDAFQECGGGWTQSYETARILRDLAKRIDGNPHFSAGYSQPLRDINGNEVGYMSVKED